MSDIAPFAWTAEPLLAPFAGHLQRTNGYVEALYRGFVVRSGFQPIFSFAHRRPVGYEGLARATDADGRYVPPPALLAAQTDVESTLYLDRLLRTLHALNFARCGFKDAWLFLNVSPRVVDGGRSRGSFFKEMLRAVGVPSHQVVVEILESETPDESALQEAALYYKRAGCLLAIDDFGAGHSNFQRLWRLKPDIVKLDRIMVSQAARDPAALRGLVGIAGLLHEIGALVLAEGIETEAEALSVLQAEVDLLQGYFFQRPFVGDPPSLDTRERFDGLRGTFLARAQAEETGLNEALEPYLETFAQAADRMAAGGDPEEALDPLLAMPRVLRCYFLDDAGTQVSGNLAGCGSTRVDPRYRPLAEVRGANWMHRHYFRRAISQPERTQVSRPYLSLIDPGLCLTLSRALRNNDGPRILCCDLVSPS